MGMERFSFAAMASRCELCVDGIAALEAASLAVEVESEVRRIEHKYSRFRQDNALTAMNNHAYARRVAIDDETSALLGYADRLYQLSGGLFDITTGALQSLWDFKAGIMPDEEALQRQLAVLGWTHVVHEKNTIRFLTPELRIDFGGIGKEYAADRAAHVLLRHGVKHGYVNLGGDIRAVGPKIDQSPWMIGIRHPRKADAIIASIPVHTGGLATSGDYERYFERDGQRYCHVLNPTNGYPARGWQSISVLAPQAITAGATATIGMLKEQDTLNFLNETGFSYLAIDISGKLHSAPAQSIPT